jgi:hypothetical protein
MKRTFFSPRKTVLIAAALTLFFVLLLSGSVVAQKQHILNNASELEIDDYDALPDAGYTLQRVMSDSTLRFSADSLRPPVSDSYWVKIVIYNPYPNNEPYIFGLTQPLNYTLYRYNPKNKSWAGTAAGLNAAAEFRKPGLLSCLLYKQVVNVFYLKVSLRDLKPYNQVVKPVIRLQKQVVFAADEQFAMLFNVVCCIVLISFSAYNLYIYFQLKDRAYLYYVWVQFGAIIYLISTNLFFNRIIPFKVYNLKAFADGRIFYINLNGVFMHISVTIIFCGFIQFTRSYLCTKQILPAYDKVLKMLSVGYILLEAIPIAITISGWYYINNVPASNLYILLLIVACMGTAVVALRKGSIAAKYFLAANLLPVVFTACTSVYILIYTSAGALLPQTATLSQILTFAVALVARIKLINEDLKAKEIEAIQLENDITVTDFKRRLMEEENKNITLTMELEKEKNELLQQRLEANQRELVGNSLYIHQKNKLLADLKLQIQDMDALYPNARPGAFKSIRSALNGGQLLDDDWDKIKIHFEQVHPSFFNNLQALHPTLTKYELRLYAYFHINLSTKEIAALLNIAPASVRQAKARLNKKMGK